MTQKHSIWTPTDAELRAALSELGADPAAIDGYLKRLGPAGVSGTRKCTSKATTESCYCNGEPTGVVWEVTCVDPDGNETTFTRCKCK